MRLAGLVDDLQTLASADAAALTLRLVPCDLTVLVDVAIDALASRFAVSGLTVTHRLEPAVIEGDPVRLHRVITNLLVNARKFTPSGGRVDVELTTERGWAQLVVSDTGVGIAPEDQAHIFDRFWRGPNASKAFGSGIGLTVVAKLVEAHRGSIAVDSLTGVGTSILLTFPLAAGAEVAGSGPAGRER